MPASVPEGPMPKVMLHSMCHSLGVPAVQEMVPRQTPQVCSTEITSRVSDGDVRSIRGLCVRETTLTSESVLYITRVVNK